MECECVEKARATLKLSFYYTILYCTNSTPPLHDWHLQSFFSNLKHQQNPRKSREPTSNYAKQTKKMKGTLNKSPWGGQRSKDIQKREWSLLLHSHTQSLTLKPFERVHAGSRGGLRDHPVRGGSERLAQQRDTTSRAILLACILPVKIKHVDVPGLRWLGDARSGGHRDDL